MRGRNSYCKKSVVDRPISGACTVDWMLTAELQRSQCSRQMNGGIPYFPSGSLLLLRSIYSVTVSSSLILLLRGPWLAVSFACWWEKEKVTRMIQERLSACKGNRRKPTVQILWLNRSIDRPKWHHSRRDGNDFNDANHWLLTKMTREATEDEVDDDDDWVGNTQHWWCSDVLHPLQEVELKGETNKDDQKRRIADELEEERFLCNARRRNSRFLCFQLQSSLVFIKRSKNSNLENKTASGSVAQPRCHLHIFGFRNFKLVYLP